MLIKNLDKIKAIAASKKISMSEVASSVGISYQQLNRIVRTQSTTFETLEKISNVLGVAPSYFIEGGEGDFIYVGDDSPGGGKGNEVNSEKVLLRAFEEIAAQRKLTEKALAELAASQKQVADLLARLDSKTNP